jgi:hypothetical protein
LFVVWDAHVVGAHIEGGLMQVRVIRGDDPSWDAQFQDAARDVYHLAGYHRLELRRGNGQPHLAVVDDGRARLMWPYLLRSIEIDGTPTGFSDITSAYGYAGPLTAGAADAAFLSDAWTHLWQWWGLQGIVSVFTRFHPVLNNRELAAGWRSPDVWGDGGDGVGDVGETVSIDCTLPDEQVTSMYAKPLRQHLANAARIGYLTDEDTEWHDLEEFVRVYSESMDRNGAGDFYRFTADDFDFLREALPDRLHLLLTRKDDEVVAGGLLTESSGIVQVHLMGTATAHLSTSPGKALLDGAQRWARSRGYPALHLGGGRGGRHDSLFRFKREFSRRRHVFSVGRWVLNAAAYVDLCQMRDSMQQATTGGDFFPAYRAPLAPATAIPVEHSSSAGPREG